MHPSHPPPAAPAGMMLFDVALECGHGDLVQRLLLPMLTRANGGGHDTRLHVR